MRSTPSGTHARPAPRSPGCHRPARRPRRRAQGAHGQQLGIARAGAHQIDPARPCREHVLGESSESGTSALPPVQVSSGLRHRARGAPARPVRKRAPATVSPAGEASSCQASAGTSAAKASRSARAWSSSAVATRRPPVPAAPRPPPASRTGPPRRARRRPRRRPLAAAQRRRGGDRREVLADAGAAIATPSRLGSTPTARTRAVGTARAHSSARLASPSEIAQPVSPGRGLQPGQRQRGAPPAAARRGPHHPGRRRRCPAVRQTGPPTGRWRRSAPPAARSLAQLGEFGGQPGAGTQACPPANSQTHGGGRRKNRTPPAGAPPPPERRHRPAAPRTGDGPQLAQAQAASGARRRSTTETTIRRQAQAPRPDRPPGRAADAGQHRARTTGPQLGQQFGGRTVAGGVADHQASTLPGADAAQVEVDGCRPARAGFWLPAPPARKPARRSRASAVAEHGARQPLRPWRGQGLGGRAAPAACHRETGRRLTTGRATAAGGPGAPAERPPARKSAQRRDGLGGSSGDGLTRQRVRRMTRRRHGRSATRSGSRRTRPSAASPPGSSAAPGAAATGARAA